MGLFSLQTYKFLSKIGHHLIMFNNILIKILSRFLNRPRERSAVKQAVVEGIECCNYPFSLIQVDSLSLGRENVCYEPGKMLYLVHIEVLKRIVRYPELAAYIIIENFDGDIAGLSKHVDRACQGSEPVALAAYPVVQKILRHLVHIRVYGRL